MGSAFPATGTTHNELLAEGLEARGVNRAYKPLGSDEVSYIISKEVDDANGQVDTWLAEDRRRALDSYFGLPFGNEQPGRSRVVLTEVADTIEWIMPSLMQMFVGGPITATYVPNTANDVEACKEATTFINQKFRDTMDGDLFLYDFFKTGLLEKRGFGTAYSEEFAEPKIQTYKHQTQLEVELILSNDKLGLEVIDFKRLPVEMVDSPDGSGQKIPMEFFDLRVMRTKKVRKIVLEGVPPEEFLIARRATKLDDETPFCTRVVKRTISYLISVGFDGEMLKGIPSDDAPEFNRERIARFQEESNLPFDTSDRNDPASREIWVYESIMRIDEDGDGYSELRRVVSVGGAGGTSGNHYILDDDYINHQPFFSWCPIPTPYKFFGQSIADTVDDLQRMKSTLLRSIFDNLYLQNNVRFEVVIGQVEMNDLIHNRPGGGIRVKRPGMLREIVTQPMGPLPMALMEFLEDTRASRTGVTRYNAALGADALAGTATGVNAMMTAAASKVALLARMAVPGVRALFRNLLRIYHEDGFQAEAFEVNGKWTMADPTRWSTDWGVQVRVGKSIGAAAQQIAELGQIMQHQKDLRSSGAGMMVSPANVFNATEDVAEAMGVSVRGRYFTDPGPAQWPPPAPDPKMVESERRTKNDQATNQIAGHRVQLEEQNDMGMMEFRIGEMKMKAETEKYRIDTDAAVRREQIAIDRERVQVEEERAEVEKERAGIEKERVEIERERVELEDRRMSQETATT